MFNQSQKKSHLLQKKVQNFLQKQLEGIEKGIIKAFGGLTVGAVDFDTAVEDSPEGFVNVVKCSVFMKHMPNLPFMVSEVSFPVEVHDMEICKALALSKALHKESEKVDLEVAI
ncbi:hypothetical protein ABC382_01050 [Lysinibacillus sp. 1P01SD]|uniref:hypothetical protein n=1 Tax=Lysinibacillus sp. 1P01SD TaxID=3132285 RepID=UPI0039A3F5C5